MFQSDGHLVQNSVCLHCELHRRHGSKELQNIVTLEDTYLILLKFYLKIGQTRTRTLNLFLNFFTSETN